MLAESQRDAPVRSRSRFAGRPKRRFSVHSGRSYKEGRGRILHGLSTSVLWGWLSVAAVEPTVRDPNTLPFMPPPAGQPRAGSQRWMRWDEAQTDRTPRFRVTIEPLY